MECRASAPAPNNIHTMSLPAAGGGQSPAVPIEHRRSGYVTLVSCGLVITEHAGHVTTFTMVLPRACHEQGRIGFYDASTAVYCSCTAAAAIRHTPPYTPRGQSSRGRAQNRCLCTLHPRRWRARRFDLLFPTQAPGGRVEARTLLWATRLEANASWLATWVCVIAPSSLHCPRCY